MQINLLAKMVKLVYSRTLEKLKPHYSLSVIKTIIKDGKVRSTLSALAGGAELGLSFAEIVTIVSELKPSAFYKSMTTHSNNRVWQDVYRPKTKVGNIYLKLTVTDDVLIVSFKEL